MIYETAWQGSALWAQMTSTYDGRGLGKWLFAGVFVAVILWLVLIPDSRIGYARRRPPAWKNARYWAILVATVQLAVYVLWA